MYPEHLDYHSEIKDLDCQIKWCKDELDKHLIRLLGPTLKIKSDKHQKHVETATGWRVDQIKTLEARKKWYTKEVYEDILHINFDDLPRSLTQRPLTLCEANKIAIAYSMANVEANALDKFKEYFRENLVLVSKTHDIFATKRSHNIRFNTEYLLENYLLGLM